MNKTHNTFPTFSTIANRSSSNTNYNSNSLRVPLSSTAAAATTQGATAAATSPTTKHQQQQQQINIAAIQKPRASYPEIMNPRLSLNGTLRHLVPSPRPLYRDHSSRSIQPLTANEQQMAELDGSFYGNVTRSGYLTTSTAAMGGGGGVVGGGGVGGGSGYLGLNYNCGLVEYGTGGSYGGGGVGGDVQFHTTELSITPSMTGDEQCIDLGSLRRFSIDRHSFLGKRFWFLLFLKICFFLTIMTAL